ncbi:MAG: hypothetical protein AAFX02_05625 [Pseudomonadota bacterium]
MKAVSSLLLCVGAVSAAAMFAHAQTVTDVSLKTEPAKATIVADASATVSAVSEASTMPEAINAPIVRPIDTMSRAAAVYGTYQGDVSTVRNKPFSTAKDIETAVTSLGGQDSEQLSRGWLAYSVLVASQSDKFRDAVREVAAEYGKDRVLLAIRRDNSFATQLYGSDDAVKAAMTALDKDSQRINTAASYVKEQAYSLQSAGWAKSKVGGRKQSIIADLGTGRSVDDALLTALASDEGDIALNHAGKMGAPSLWEGVQKAAQTIRFPTLTGGSFGQQVEQKSAARADLAHRINVMAAYRLLGFDGEGPNQVQMSLADPLSKRCVVKAQLNLKQCVAAVHQQHELPFCISEHALKEVSSCIDNIVE